MTDTRPPPVQAERSTRKAGHRKKASPALIVVPLLLVLAAVVLFFVLFRGEGGGIPFVGGGGDSEAPPFDFDVGKVRAVATTEDANASALSKRAASIEKEVTPIVDDLYTNAFLDPANWNDGDYAEVFERFTESARPAAEANVETLTLGANAGDVYDDVAPGEGKLEYKVLFDQGGEVSQVVVTVEFSALGTRADGGFTEIVSQGQLFFDDPGSWLVSAFDVERADREGTPPSPTATSGTPST